MHEGRPQRFGTQWINDSRDGRFRPWKLGEPNLVNQLRAEVGLDTLQPVPESGPELPPEKQRKLSMTTAGGKNGWPAKAGAMRWTIYLFGQVPGNRQIGNLELASAWPASARGIDLSNAAARDSWR